MSENKPVGRVKACIECRQQKVRCDAFKDYSKPCSRCRAAQLPCIISKDFQRRKRQTKAQLQYELDRLRGNTREASTEDDVDQSPTVSEPADSARDVPSDRIAQQQSPSSTRNSKSEVGSTNSVSKISLHHDRSREPEQSQPPSQPFYSNTTNLIQRPLAQDHDGTQSRTLSNVKLSGQIIGDCYQLFLEHYAPHLEGLFDQQFTPDERYKQCPILFWAMIYVGSRRYTQDLTIFNQLEDLVSDMAFHSFKRPPQPLLVLLAALILCSWPVSVDFIYRDTSQALAGAAYHFAVQQGLHMYYQEQVFLPYSMQRTSDPMPNPAEMTSAMYKAIKLRDAALVFRTRVWSYSSMVFQSTSLCDGLPALSLVPCFRRPEIYGEISRLLPDRLSYRSRLHKIQTTATNVICDSCDLEGKGVQSHLNAMITSFDDNVRTVPMPQKDHWFQLMRSTARLLILGLYFVAQTEPDHTSMAQLYNVARDVIHHGVELDKEGKNFTCYMPHYYVRMTYYALNCLLRVIKSPLGEKVDKVEATASFNAGINIMKERSKYRDIDLGGQSITVLSQLWDSDKAFVRGNERQNGLRVDVRHRLVLNPLFDSFWWWRKEFGPPTELEPHCVFKRFRAKQADAASTTNRSMYNLATSVPLSRCDPGGVSDNMMLDNFLPGFMDWDFSIQPTDLGEFNTWLESTGDCNNFEYQPWELPLGPR